jgi:hypothetical protein
MPVANPFPNIPLGALSVGQSKSGLGQPIDWNLTGTGIPPGQRPLATGVWDAPAPVGISPAQRGLPQWNAPAPGGIPPGQQPRLPSTWDTPAPGGVPLGQRTFPLPPMSSGSWPTMGQSPWQSPWQGGSAWGTQPWWLQQAPSFGGGLGSPWGYGGVAQNPYTQPSMYNALLQYLLQNRGYGG